MDTTKTKPRYHIKQFARERWHVIGPSGIPLYDDAPHGRDKPLIFRDEDVALEYAERCNTTDQESFLE